MYKIIRKGNHEPLFLADDVGQVLFKKWAANEDLPPRLTVDNTVFLTADIKAIEKLGKTEAERAPDNKQSEREYWEFRKKMLALPIETRATFMRIPNIVWVSLTNEPMPNEIKTEIVKRQVEYFKENPKCMYASPKIYLDLMPKPKPQRPSETLNPIQNILPTTAVDMVARIIQADVRDSRFA